LEAAPQAAGLLGEDSSMLRGSWVALLTVIVSLLSTAAVWGQAPPAAPAVRFGAPNADQAVPAGPAPVAAGSERTDMTLEIRPAGQAAPEPALLEDLTPRAPAPRRSRYRTVPTALPELAPAGSPVTVAAPPDVALPLPRDAETPVVQVIPPALLSPDKIFLEMDAKNALLNKRLDELSKRYEELRKEVKKKEEHKEGASAASKEAKRDEPGKEARGYGRPARSRAEPMYKIGWFWWRDDTKEITGRQPYYPDMAPYEHEVGEGLAFGDGLQWNSQDKYFRLIFHNLSQLDLREPIQQGQPLHGGFIIPRQRWYFEGKVGDYADFVTSINRGYGTLDLLDSYVDYSVNREYLKFRVGRFKMPSQYEYIDIAEADLIGPERSLFVANFAANRQLGAMAHGYLFDRRIHYYTAMSNGPRRSFEDFNSDFDYFLYVDYMPFTNNEDSLLQNLHMVGTYNFGEERNPVGPSSVQTLNQDSASASALTVSPTILQFGTNTFENGPRQFWGQEMVYYYKSFGLLSSVQGGYQDYSVSKTGVGGLAGFQNANGQLLGVGSANRTHVPIHGWSLGGWYFITGEEITRRRFLVEPKSPFGFYNGGLHPGVIELFGRVANLELGNQIFTGGLVNKADWTNRATSTDIGFNWYINHYIKFTVDWQHTMLGDSVILNPTNGKRTRQYDMFLFRTQLFF
jgi:phosphate-selective porin OprO and OprP